MKHFYKLFILLLFPSAVLMAQGYELVWEENFDGASLNPDVWNVETAIGIWNTGANQELQHYRAENVSVGPDGLGNNALIITAKRENYNGYQFTSGRINTRSKVAARYGKIEARIKLPQLANGFWPAFWMLGSKNGWPASGEIDIMEAGHSQGIQTNLQERTLNGALHWEHADAYAGYGPQALAPEGTSLYDYNRFIMVWTPTRIEMFLNDATTPYFAMDITGADAEEFRDWAHYFILNLAVGGSFTGITNPAGITAPMPANMYVDYIKVYQKAGEGEMVITPPAAPPTGDYYGIFTERESITEKFNIDEVTGHLYLWNNLVAMSGQSPFEGSEILAFNSPAAGWCGFGIFSDQPLDLRHYATGYMNFAVKIPTGSVESFDVKVEGASGTSGAIPFTPGNDPSGVSRDGKWHFVSVPMPALTAQGLNLSACGNIFAVVSGNSTSGFIFDDVFLSVSKPTPVLDPLAGNTRLTVYPNPARQSFTVNVNQMMEKLEVVNLSGVVVFRSDSKNSSDAYAVNCSGWAQGMYLVRVTGTDGKVMVDKIEIQ